MSTHRSAEHTEKVAELQQKQVVPEHKESEKKVASLRTQQSSVDRMGEDSDASGASEGYDDACSGAQTISRGSFSELSPRTLSSVSESSEQRGSHRNEEIAKEWDLIFVGSLKYSTPKEKVQVYFEQYGKVVECSLVMESDQRLSKGYGFVRFATAEAAALAAKVPHPKIDGRRTNVNYAHTGRKAPYRGGSKQNQSKKSGKKSSAFDSEKHRRYSSDSNRTSDGVPMYGEGYALPQMEFPVAPAGVMPTFVGGSDYVVRTAVSCNGYIGYAVFPALPQFYGTAYVPYGSY